jgi:hypothetical protein
VLTAYCLQACPALCFARAAAAAVAAAADRYHKARRCPPCAVAGVRRGLQGATQPHTSILLLLLLLMLGFQLWLRHCMQLRRSHTHPLSFHVSSTSAFQHDVLCCCQACCCC